MAPTAPVSVDAAAVTAGLATPLLEPKARDVAADAPASPPVIDRPESSPAAVSPPPRVSVPAARDASSRATKRNDVAPPVRSSAPVERPSLPSASTPVARPAQPLPDLLPPTSADLPSATATAGTIAASSENGRVAVTGPPPVTAPVVTPKVPAPSPVSSERIVRGVLNEYAAAYSALDADAAQRLWPDVNRAALARAFAGLASQQIALDNCRIDLAGSAAHAECRGTMKWTPRVGDRRAKTERRTWTFDLAERADGWRITSARAAQNK